MPLASTRHFTRAPLPRTWRTAARLARRRRHQIAWCTGLWVLLVILRTLLIAALPPYATPPFASTHIGTRVVSVYVSTVDPGMFICIPSSTNTANNHGMNPPMYDWFEVRSTESGSVEPRWKETATRFRYVRVGEVVIHVTSEPLYRRLPRGGDALWAYRTRARLTYPPEMWDFACMPLPSESELTTICATYFDILAAGPQSRVRDIVLSRTPFVASAIRASNGHHFATLTSVNLPAALVAVQVATHALWAIPVMWLIALALWWRGVQNRRLSKLQQRGLMCSKCKYVNAIPGLAVCPECGTGLTRN